MMIPATTFVLMTALFLQEPPQPPPTPTPPETPRPADPAVPSIDPELRAALDAFRKASGFRFQVEGHDVAMTRAAPFARADRADREENVARAKERSPTAEGDDVRMDAAFERGKPIHFTGGELEAYRAADKVIYKTKGKEEWSVLTKPASRPEQARGEGGDGREEPRLLMFVARVPAPNELLENLESRITSCTRLPAEDPKGGTSATFECALRPDATHAAATLRIVLATGHVDRLTLTRRPPLESSGGTAAPPPPGNPPQNPPVPPANPPRNPDDPTTSPARPVGATPAASTAADSVFRYKVSEIGATSVTVPEAVMRLLGE